MLSLMIGMLKFKSESNFKLESVLVVVLPGGQSCFAVPASQRQGKKKIFSAPLASLR